MEGSTHQDVKMLNGTVKSKVDELEKMKKIVTTSNNNIVKNGEKFCRPQYPIVDLQEHMGTNVFNLTDFEEIHSLDVQAEDIWVISFPRSGTTLTQEIVYLLAKDLDFENARAESLDTRFPFLDLLDIRAPTCSGPSYVKSVPPPRLIKSHLHLHVMPKNVQELTPKIVYVARNPRDVIVSNYFYTKNLRNNVPEMTMEEYLKAFLAEATYATPWWQHVKDYWKKRNHPNVLFILYEDLVEKAEKITSTIAEFLGKTVTQEDIMKIVEHCTFENMKNNPAVNGVPELDMFSQQLRRGKIGSWKEHFTAEMVAMVDQMVEDKLGDTDLVFTYEARDD